MELWQVVTYRAGWHLWSKATCSLEAVHWFCLFFCSGCAVCWSELVFWTSIASLSSACLFAILWTRILKWHFLIVVLFQLITVPETLVCPNRAGWGAPDLSAARSYVLFELISGPRGRKSISWSCGSEWFLLSSREVKCWGTTCDGKDTILSCQKAEEMDAFLEGRPAASRDPSEGPRGKRQSFSYAEKEHRPF